MPSTNGSHSKDIKAQVVGSKDLPHTGCEYSLSSWHQYKLLLQRSFSQLRVCQCAPSPRLHGTHTLIVIPPFTNGNWFTTIHMIYTRLHFGKLHNPPSPHCVFRASTFQHGVTSGLMMITTRENIHIELFTHQAALTTIAFLFQLTEKQGSRIRNFSHWPLGVIYSAIVKATWHPRGIGSSPHSWSPFIAHMVGPFKSRAF